MQCIMHVVVEIANARFWLNGLVLGQISIHLFIQSHSNPKWRPPRSFQCVWEDDVERARATLG